MWSDHFLLALHSRCCQISTNDKLHFKIKIAFFLKNAMLCYKPEFVVCQLWCLTCRLNVSEWAGP